MTTVMHSCGMRKPGVSPVPVVSLINDQPRTLSTDVAAFFSKRHDHVLRQIRAIIDSCPDDFRRPNFGESSYLNDQGKLQPAYSLTKDGFTLLAMGFTGPKALQFKLAYIQAFNRMEAELSRRMPAERMPADSPPSFPGAPASLTDVVHMGSTIDYSRTLRQMARIRNYSPAQRLAFLAEAASVLSGRPAQQFLPEQFDPSELPSAALITNRDTQIRKDAMALAERIIYREREQLPPLPVTKAGTILFGWGSGRSVRAADYALENALLRATPSTNRKGRCFASPNNVTTGEEA